MATVNPRIPSYLIYLSPNITDNKIIYGIINTGIFKIVKLEFLL